MSPLVFACVLTVCLIAQIRVGVFAELEDSATTAPVSPARTCQLSGYNIKDLQRYKYWSANVTTTLDKRSVCLGANVTSCTLYLSFCQALQVSMNLTNCTGSAVCQVGTEATGMRQFVFSMGQFQADGTEFREIDGTIKGGFFMHIDGGSRNIRDPFCQLTNVSTTVVWVCNSTAKWTSSDITDFVTVEYDLPTNCSYQITLQYDGACIASHQMTSTTSAMPNPTPSLSSTSTTSSASSSNTTSVSPTSASSVTGITTHIPMSVNTTHIPMSGSASHVPMSGSASHIPMSGSISHMSSDYHPVTTPINPMPPTTHTTEHTTHPPTTHKTEHPTHPPTNHPATTQPSVDPDKHKIAGLTAGVVIFALISFVLLLLLIAAIWYFKRGSFRYRTVADNEDM